MSEIQTKKFSSISDPLLDLYEESKTSPEIPAKKSSQISDRLLDLYDETTNSTGIPKSTNNLEAVSSNSDILQIDESETRVLTRITSSDVEGLLPVLENLGFEVLGSAPDLNFLEGWMPIDSIPDLDNLEERGLMGVLPVYAPIANAGSATSQADFVQEADRVRASLPTSFDGDGVSIGVLSDSYDNLGGASNDVSSNDLPANVNVLQDLSSGGSDEGRAMLQLVHDLAPGSDLAFATAFLGPASFGNNIRALANAGSDVIVDDVGYLTEPFFQDGVVSLAVDDVVTNNDVAYFSSAGNSGNIAYESANINFVTDTIAGITDNFYDFDPGANVDTRQRITIPNGAQVRLSFQWDDPFFTTNGVDTDLDIFLLDGSGNVVGRSEENNIGNQTPSEFLGFINNTGQTDFDVAIRLFSGPEPGRIKYIPFDLSSDPADIYQEFATNSSTIFAHPAATNASAVAAVPYFDQENPESFTSVGPTTILFEADGTPKPTPEIRQTPDIAAIDGTDTTFFGQALGGDGGNFPNFFGTSAAAPHAAAIAALVKEANPTFTPDQIYDKLESTATDLDPAGFDNVTGNGLVNAYDAIFGSVVPTPLNFTDDFEDGDLPLAYETNTNGAGRIQVTTENNPIGTQHLTLDSSFAGADSLNEVILHVDTTNFTDVQFSFDQREFGDEDNIMPATFTGSNDSDGVALSVDGTNWFSLVSLTGSNSTETYQTQSFDLSTFAANNGLTLGSDVRIKFQQFDNFAIATDGFAFDNISVTGTAASTPLVKVNGTAIANPVESYGGPSQDVTGTAEVSPSNQLNLSGNNWKKVEINSTITADTILSFEFTGNGNSEIQGIGFDNDNSISTADDASNFFQVDGSQNWGIQNLSQFIVGQSGDKDVYSIPVGNFFTGDFDFLTIGNDDDQTNPDAEAQFSNIELSESTSNLLDISVDGVTQSKDVLAYGGAAQNPSITSTVIGDNKQLNLEGNGWRSVDINGYEVTENTFLSFEFSGNGASEIQGIGFDNNNSISTADDASNFFQVDGSQNWGNQNLSQFIVGQSGGKDIYSIPVGNFFTGNFDFLTIGNDDDQGNPDAQGQFSNIELSEGNPNLLDISIDGVTQSKDVLAYGGTSQNPNITSTVINDNKQLNLEGNGWRSLDITGYEVDADTLLRFDFKGNGAGEIQGIGFDTNNSISTADDASNFFQVNGSQNWGIDDLDPYILGTSNGFTQYEIPVGNFFTGQFDSLTIGNDHDIANPTAIGQFQNIELQNIELVG